ncbi:MAG: hypothetical protein QM750_00160 [Rubrivivax sp.]
MSASAAFTRSWRVGSHVATLSVPRAGGFEVAVIEWLPGRLSADELHQYRQGRDRALAELAAELAVDVVVVDL